MSSLSAQYLYYRNTQKVPPVLQLTRFVSKNPNANTSAFNVQLADGE